MTKRTLDDIFETMPWERINAVVFDVGNVLLTFSPEVILERYVPGYRPLFEQLKKRVFHSPYWVMLDHGTLTYPEAFEAMTVGCPELAEPVRIILERWEEMRDVIPEGVGALRKCAAMGKKIYIISNYHDHPFDTIEKKYDFFRLIDGKVISSRVRMVKPDPAIYRHAELTFGLEPAGTLFIDDSPLNVAAAMSCGWQGVSFSYPGQLKKFFALDEA